MVEETTGGGDEDIESLFEIGKLRAVADAAVDDADTQVGKAGVVAQGGFDLGGEFAGGFENEGAQGAVLGEFGEDRESESGGLTRAGLGRADDVGPLQDKRDGAELDGCGIDIAHRLDAMDDILGKAELLKRHSTRIAHSCEEASFILSETGQAATYPAG